MMMTVTERPGLLQFLCHMIMHRNKTLTSVAVRCHSIKIFCHHNDILDVFITVEIHYSHVYVQKKGGVGTGMKVGSLTLFKQILVFILKASTPTLAFSNKFNKFTKNNDKTEEIVFHFKILCKVNYLVEKMCSSGDCLELSLYLHILCLQILKKMFSYALFLSNSHIYIYYV